jgi:hypothetical protein
MMSVKPLVLLLCLAGFCAGQGSAKKSTVSYEEELVRAVYAKLSCAAQIGTSWHAIEQGDGQTEAKDRLASNQATDQQSFELSDFTVGDLRRVGTAPWTSLVAGPVGVLGAQYRELSVKPTGQGSKSSFNLIYADLTWKTSAELQDVAQIVRTDKVLTITEFVQGLRQPEMSDGWERYASYTVVARLGEHSISYRATFLFSGHHETEEILPLDYATAMKIAPFVKARICPTVVASTIFHGVPLLQASIMEHEACRWTKAHGEGSCDQDTSTPNKATSAVVSHQVRAGYAVGQCKKTVDQLPTVCPAAEKRFSEFAGTIANTTISDSQSALACGWICSHHSDSNWHVQHGPWALDFIAARPINGTPRTIWHEVKNDQKQ